MGINNLLKYLLIRCHCVHAYNVSWDKWTPAYGEFLGGLLGMAWDVDAEDDGSQMGKFLCIRVEVPLNKCLQPKIAIGRGAHETSSFPA